MNYRDRLFVDAVRTYPNFKNLFKSFCDEAAKRLKDNAKLPGVHFSPGENGTGATLQAFDHTFHISFDFLVSEDTPWGMLRVTLLGEGKEPIQLFQLLVDDLGNVKTTPDARAEPHSLSSAEFVMAFVNHVAYAHFLRLSTSR